MERTFVIIKPDAVERGLIGEIINRFEKVGLKIIGAKFIVATDEVLNKHYPDDRPEWVKGLGDNTLRSYGEMGMDAKDQFGTDDAAKIGAEVRQWLVDFMKSGPVFAMVLEGPHVVEVTRKIVGSTLPQKANPGTIRGDHSYDSPHLANANSRPIKNLIHASGNTEEAEFEIGLWFAESELHSYDTIHQKHMNS